MSKKPDWFSEQPPTGHADRVLQKAMPELLKNRSRQTMPWFFARRWLVAYSALVAIASFTLWMNYQEESNLQDKAGVLGWSEELEQLDIKTISEVDLHEDMDLLDNMDIIEEMPVQDES
jgi:hypothetical protein